MPSYEEGKTDIGTGNDLQYKILSTSVQQSPNYETTHHKTPLIQMPRKPEDLQKTCTGHYKCVYLIGRTFAPNIFLPPQHRASYALNGRCNIRRY
jgi:hypothetical protein